MTDDLCEVIVTTPIATGSSNSVASSSTPPRFLAACHSSSYQHLPLGCSNPRDDGSPNVLTLDHHCAGRVDRVDRVVVTRHPYDIPNVTVLPIVGANPQNLRWLAREMWNLFAGLARVHAFLNLSTTSVRIRLCKCDESPEFGGGRYRLEAGSGRSDRSISDKPTRSAADAMHASLAT